MSVRSEQSEASAADDGDDGGDGGDGGASMTDENVVENIRKGKTRPKIPLQKTKSVQPPKMVVACMMVIYPTVLGLVETLVQVSLKAITSLFSFTLACDNQVRAYAARVRCLLCSAPLTVLNPFAVLVVVVSAPSRRLLCSSRTRWQSSCWCCS